MNTLILETTLILKIRCERCHKQLLSAPIQSATEPENAHVLAHLCYESATNGPKLWIWTEQDISAHGAEAAPTKVEG